MIDFRYHIVSLIAVFLALGVGVIVGTTVLDAQIVTTLETNVDTLRGQLEEQRSTNSALREQRDESEAVIEQLGGWIVAGRLQGTRLIVVTDAQNGRWREGIIQTMRTAGAEHAGTLVLTDRFSLSAEGAAGELAAIAGVAPEAVSAPEQETPAEAEARAETLARTTLALFGERLPAPEGRDLMMRLAEAGYVQWTPATAARPDPERGPSSGAVVLVLASSADPSGGRAAWLSAFALGAAKVNPVVAAAQKPDESGAVEVIRGTAELPATVATFDDGEASFAGTALVLVTRAAVDGRGGHFGVNGGRRVLPPPV